MKTFVLIEISLSGARGNTRVLGHYQATDLDAAVALTGRQVKIAPEEFNLRPTEHYLGETKQGRGRLFLVESTELNGPVQ